MDIIMVRHGESEANVAEIFGDSQTKLSETGREQVLKSREYVNKLKFHRVYTSPFHRAIETMELLGLEGDIEDDIRELGFGILENKPYGSINKDYPEEAKKWAENPFSYTITGGETILEAYKRVERFLNKLIQRDEDVLLVCHKGVIRMALSFVFDNPEYFFKFRVANSSINIISIDGGSKSIKSLNKIVY